MGPLEGNPVDRFRVSVFCDEFKHKIKELLKDPERSESLLPEEDGNAVLRNVVILGLRSRLSNLETLYHMIPSAGSKPWMIGS